MMLAPGVEEGGESDTQSHPWLYSELAASLYYTRLFPNF